MALRFQPPPSPQKSYRLAPNVCCLGPRRRSRSDLCGKGGAQTMPVLQPWCSAWDQLFSGEAGHPALRPWDVEPGLVGDRVPRPGSVPMAQEQLLACFYFRFVKPCRISRPKTHDGATTSWVRHLRKLPELLVSATTGKPLRKEPGLPVPSSERS